MPHDRDKDLPFFAALQDNGRITVKELAHRSGLTLGACTKRIQRALSDGSIIRFTAIFNHDLFGFNTLAYTFLKCATQNREVVKTISDALLKSENVIEIHKMLGDYDFLIKTLTRNTTELQAILETIGDTGAIKEVRTLIMSETIRDECSLPASKLLSNNMKKR